MDLNFVVQLVVALSYSGKGGEHRSYVNQLEFMRPLLGIAYGT
jgi:hypothetical protein